MATVNSDLGYTPQVHYLVNRVRELSAGTIRIDMVYQVGGYAPGAEQQVVRGVAAGTFDLGFAGTRIFDTLGVRSFQALTAPMLVDSYPLERAVTGSGIPRQMMAGLGPLHVTGLGVLADGLRKPIAAGAPLLGLRDWRGITFASFRSQGQAEAIRALGARVSNLFGPPLNQALAGGTVQGFEKNLLVYHENNMEAEAPYVTANVNLWPQTLAVIANPGRLAGLTPRQRGWLDQAARDAATRSTALADGDPGLLASLCKSGTRFANASAADIAAMRKAFAPVYAHLEQDPQTRTLIAEIGRLKDQTPPGAALVIPRGCTGPAPAPAPSPGSSPPRTTTVTPLDGAWQVTITRAQLLAQPLVPGEDNPSNYGHLTLVFHRGYMRYTGGNGSFDAGPYVVHGKWITIYTTSATQPADVGGPPFTLTWSVYRDTLTFTRTSTASPAVFVVKPWTPPAG
jgi:TRAP-type C4-dicarboxylate transport system substrate-binding protein